MKEIGIGLLGFGTVGAGVVEGIQKNSHLIARRLGVKLALRRLADLDLESDRGVRVDPAIMTRNAREAIHDPSVDVVVELIGGTGVARDFIRESIEAGKPVVTANKALLAEHGRELFELAARKGVPMGFEASVGGGIPIIRALREGLVADRINAIFGILNGTCNYILTRMEQENLAFDDALVAAQKEGYAEANPGLDIDGHDTAHKAAVLATLAFGSAVPLRNIVVRGIRGLAKADMDYALGLGYRVKLLAVIRRRGAALDIRVHPALLPLDHVLSSVSGVYNAILIESDMAGRTLYYGRGAGRLPTASAVLSDISSIARAICFDGRHALPSLPRLSDRGLRIAGAAQSESRFYLRMALSDRPGVLGRLATILGRHNVSIASVLQQEGRSGRCVPVVILTHRAKERDVGRAVALIDRLRLVGSRTVSLRIED